MHAVSTTNIVAVYRGHHISNATIVDDLLQRSRLPHFDSVLG